MWYDKIPAIIAVALVTWAIVMVHYYKET